MEAARVSAATRLHFGLLHAHAGRDQGAFGGLGAMVQFPRVETTAAPARTWEFSGSLAARAQEFVKQIQAHHGALEPASIRAEGPPEHAGLGIGTALGLSLVALLVPEHPNPAKLIGRGQRSRIGTCGFSSGGFWLDDTHSTHRLPWPSEWRFVLLLPQHGSTWHGAKEQAAFARLRTALARLRTDQATLHNRLLSICHEQIIPALLAHDFERFAKALGLYNHAAGEPFQFDQAGPYASPAVQAEIETLNALGFPGAGQSSWGPTVFVPVPSADAGQQLIDHFSRLGRPCCCTTVDDRGAIQEKML